MRLKVGDAVVCRKDLTNPCFKQYCDIAVMTTSRPMVIKEVRECANRLEQCEPCPGLIRLHGCKTFKCGMIRRQRDPEFTLAKDERMSRIERLKNA